MKNIIVTGFLALCLSLSVFAQQAVRMHSGLFADTFSKPPLKAQPLSVKKYQVTGKILATNPYCGGARPPDYILEESYKPKPVQGCEVIIECDGKEVFSVKTSADGSFSTSLPPGKYSVFIGEQKKSFSFLSKKFKDNGCYFDDNNLKKWLATPCIQFTVKDKDVKGLKAEFTRNCDTDSFCNYIHKPNTRP